MLSKIDRQIYYLCDKSNGLRSTKLATDSVQLVEISCPESFFRKLRETDLSQSHFAVMVDKDLCLDSLTKFLPSLNLLKGSPCSLILPQCQKLRAVVSDLFDELAEYFEPSTYVKDSNKFLEAFFADEDSHGEVYLDGQLLEGLTCKQKALIRLFLSSENRTIKRETILEKVWGDMTIKPKTVDVHLYNLRRKIHPYGYLIRSEGGGCWKLLSERIDQNKS